MALEVVSVLMSLMSLSLGTNWQPIQELVYGFVFSDTGYTILVVSIRQVLRVIFRKSTMDFPSAVFGPAPFRRYSYEISRIVLA